MTFAIDIFRRKKIRRCYLINLALPSQKGTEGLSTGFIFFFGKGLKNFFNDFRIKIGEQKKKGNKQFNRISDQPR